MVRLCGVSRRLAGCTEASRTSLLSLPAATKCSTFRESSRERAMRHARTARPAEQKQHKHNDVHASTVLAVSILRWQRCSNSMIDEARSSMPPIPYTAGLTRSAILPYLYCFNRILWACSADKPPILHLLRFKGRFTSFSRCLQRGRNIPCNAHKVCPYKEAILLAPPRTALQLSASLFG